MHLQTIRLSLVFVIFMANCLFRLNGEWKLYIPKQFAKMKGFPKRTPKITNKKKMKQQPNCNTIAFLHLFGQHTVMFGPKSKRTKPNENERMNA